MSDSENRLEHLQVENDMTNESPGNIERTGGGEVAEDQPARGGKQYIGGRTWTVQEAPRRPEQ